MKLTSCTLLPGAREREGAYTLEVLVCFKPSPLNRRELFNMTYQSVYLNSRFPSMTSSPFSAFLFLLQNTTVKIAIVINTTTLHTIVPTKPHVYSGASCERKISEPAIPPTPPRPVVKYQHAHNSQEQVRVTCQSCRTESTLPLSTDIVRLIRHHS